MLIYLPPGAHGEKVGVDDYLADGHGIEDLLQLATHELRSAASDSDDHDRPYDDTAAGLIWNKPTRDGPVETALANFTARIISDVVEDDGVERRRLFEIDATLHGRRSTFRVPAPQFMAMNWPAEHLGAGAIVYPGFGAKDHARTAIQLLSGDVTRRDVYAHTGWRFLNERWVYLHAAGGIDESGATETYTVNLSGPLSRIALGDPPAGADRRRTVEASIALLSLAPFSVTAPVLSVTYLAPLVEALGSDAPDFVCWVHGPSGQFKSEVAALAQAHYGAFTRQTLPASFGDTANAIERLCFAAKDAVIVVDDYHPALDRKQEQAMAGVAARLLRTAGNRSGRQRMKADTSMRDGLPPRGLAIATGERRLPGHSNAARMFPVAIEKNAVDVAMLTECQADASLLPQAMAAYIQWLAGRVDQLRTSLPRRFRELRARAGAATGHAREPGQVAHLQLGLEMMLEFAVVAGALSEPEREALLLRTWSALLEIAAEHRQELAAETPTQAFLALLADGIASKRAYLEDVGGGPCDDAAAWGWEETTRLDAFGATQRELRHGGAATLIGRVDDEWLYLVPQTVYQFVTTAARAADQLFPVDLTTLLRRLGDDGLIAREATSGRRTVKVRFGEKTPRVVKLRRSALDSLLPSERGEQREQGEQPECPDSNIPFVCSPAGVGKGNTGNGSGEQSDSDLASVPRVPSVPSHGGREAPEREMFAL